MNPLRQTNQTQPSAAALPSPARVGMSCVICAFNEGPRIAAVLAVVSVHPALGEVIVVDDGSIDATAQVVGGFPSVRLISLPLNRGKSGAMAAGLAAAQFERVMLLDADLSGLTVDAVTALAEPVLSGRSEVSLSLRGNSLSLFRWAGIDFVTGERVIARSLLAHSLATLNTLPGFGVEVYMNREIVARQLSIAVVDWPGVYQARKTQKMGMAAGVWAEFRMIGHLLRTAAPWTLLHQALVMKRLLVKPRNVTLDPEV
jgi:glycosyltransferase involved in cell wall biosynthesis